MKFPKLPRFFHKRSQSDDALYRHTQPAVTLPPRPVSASFSNTTVQSSSSGPSILSSFLSTIPTAPITVTPTRPLSELSTTTCATTYTILSPASQQTIIDALTHRIHTLESLHHTAQTTISTLTSQLSSLTHPNALLTPVLHSPDPISALRTALRDPSSPWAAALPPAPRSPEDYIAQVRCTLAARLEGRVWRMRAQWWRARARERGEGGVTPSSSVLEDVVAKEKVRERVREVKGGGVRRKASAGNAGNAPTLVGDDLRAAVVKVLRPSDLEATVSAAQHLDLRDKGTAPEACIRSDKSVELTGNAGSLVEDPTPARRHTADVPGASSLDIKPTGEAHPLDTGSRTPCLPEPKEPLEDSITDADAKTALWKNASSAENLVSARYAVRTAADSAAVGDRIQSPATDAPQYSDLQNTHSPDPEPRASVADGIQSSQTDAPRNLDSGNTQGSHLPDTTTVSEASSKNTLADAPNSEPSPSGPYANLPPLASSTFRTSHSIRSLPTRRASLPPSASASSHRTSASGVSHRTSASSSSHKITASASRRASDHRTSGSLTRAVEQLFSGSDVPALVPSNTPLASAPPTSPPDIHSPPSASSSWDLLRTPVSSSASPPRGFASPCSPTASPPKKSRLPLPVLALGRRLAKPRAVISRPVLVDSTNAGVVGDCR